MANADNNNPGKAEIDILSESQLDEISGGGLGKIPKYQISCLECSWVSPWGTEDQVHWLWVEHAAAMGHTRNSQRIIS